MKNLKLTMYAAASLLTLPVVSHADFKSATMTKFVPSPTNDLAPVSGTPARLRRTDEEQPGNEMPALAFFAGNTKGLFFVMNTELNGTPAQHRMQLAMVPFNLELKDGAVTATPNLAAATHVTNNRGNEYRNANYPEAFAIDDGKAVCAAYNYQAQGTSDTVRYLKCFNEAGAVVMNQTPVMAKNNDDCAMRQDGAGFMPAGANVNGKQRWIAYGGCNGNGNDNGWLFVYNIERQADNSYKITKQFDVTLANEEERSRGYCTVSDADPNTAYCTYTEGNNQPQRRGTWLAAVALDTNARGADQRQTILWKQQIGGRKQIEGITTYSMRAMHTRVMEEQAGKLVNTDMILWRSGDVQGNNNTNNGKGGAYLANQMAVMKLTRQGMTYVTPMTNVAPKLRGLDGTHLAPVVAMMGAEGALKPAILFNSGSQTGGGNQSQVRAVVWDQATGFSDGGMQAVATHDRHLYPNYLGNNPGNQGRNHAAGYFIKNPFAGQGSTDAYLTVWATSGKDLAEMTNPAKKLSTYVSVLPVAQTAPAATQPQPSPQPSDPQQPAPEPEPETEEETSSGSSDATLGGCSAAGGSAGGFASVLLLGLVGLIKRRRR